MVILHLDMHSSQSTVFYSFQAMYNTAGHATFLFDHTLVILASSYT